MKRYLSLFLTMILAMSVFTACGKQEAPEDVKLPGEDENETLNLYGETISYGINEILGYQDDSVFADNAVARVKAVEKMYNFTFKFLEDLDVSSAVPAALAVGDIAADILRISSYGQASMIKNDSFYNMLEVSDIINVLGDPEKWGNKNQLSSFVWNDSLYAVLPMYYPQILYSACDFAIFVNEDMVQQELNLEDPREFVENKTWNREKFGELVKAYTHTEGENEITGLAMFVNHFFDMTMRASGIDYAVKTDGGWVSGFSTPKAQSAFEWARSFIYTDHAGEITVGDTYPMINRFVEGGSAMVMTHIGFALNPVDTSSYKSIAYNVKNFGILPFPLSDDQPYGEWIGQHEYMNFGIAFQANTDIPEYLAQIVNALYEPFENYATAEDRLAYYNDNLFHDPRDADIVFKMLENCRYTYYIDGARTVVDTFATSSSRKTVSEILESTSSSYAKVMEETIIPSYESIEHIWGE